MSYKAAHARCIRLWGSARLHPCIGCGGPAADWAYDGTDPTALLGRNRCWYSRWPEFYAPMCKRCHRQFDLTWYSRVRLPAPPRAPKPVPSNPRTEAEWRAWERARKQARRQADSGRPAESLQIHGPRTN